MLEDGNGLDNPYSYRDLHWAWDQRLPPSRVL